jgi:hypothetical protein
MKRRALSRKNLGDAAPPRLKGYVDQLITPVESGRPA